MTPDLPGHNIEGVHVKAFAVQDTGSGVYYIEVEVWTQIGNRKVPWALQRFPTLSLAHAIKVANAYNEAMP